MNNPTQPMTAEQILTAMYVTNDGTVSGTAAEMRQARTAVAESIRRNGELSDALRLIGRYDCEKSTAKGMACVDNRGLTRGAPFTADAWCDACVANYALVFTCTIRR